MTKRDKVEAIINEIINNPAADYSYAGQTFMNGATEQQAKNIEIETLSSIADGGDKDVLKTIAKWEISKYDPSDLEKKLFIFTLGHRSGYTKNLGGSNEICVTSNSLFLQRAVKDNLIPQVNMEPGTSLTQLYQDKDGYCQIGSESGNNIYFIGENNKLFGREKRYSFTYFTSTAACLYSTNMEEPISYDGYCFENRRGRNNYATGGARDHGQYFYLTPGGGPLTEDNWIVKYVQYGTRSITSEDISKPNDYWVYKSGDSYLVIVKIYIHLFMPDGSYVRTVLDRSDDANFGDLTPTMEKWIYKDYANDTAKRNGHSFASVWNDILGNYRNVGGSKNYSDVSFYWNGYIDEEVKREEVAYHYLNHTIWSAAGQRQG